MTDSNETFPSTKSLSSKIYDLWFHVGNVYTHNIGGIKFTADDFQFLLGKLNEFLEDAVALEEKVPPPPPKIEVSNVIDFNQFKKRK